MIRCAEDRRSASVMIISSIRLSFAGFDVDWMMNMSSPRTFSNTSTKISWSLNRSTRVLTSSTVSPRCIEMRRAIAVASGRFELPAISFGLNIGFMAGLFAVRRGFEAPLSPARGPCKAPRSGRCWRPAAGGPTMAEIDYFLFPLSPFSYLAGPRARGDGGAARGEHRLQAGAALPHLRRGRHAAGEGPAPVEAGLPAAGHRPAGRGPRGCRSTSSRGTGRPTRCRPRPRSSPRRARAAATSAGWCTASCARSGPRSATSPRTRWCATSSPRPASIPASPTAA